MLRLDGAYGWARGAYICQQNSLGYLIHCSDYGLLTHPQVEARLANARAESFYQVDTGKLRQIYDAGFITWSAGKDPSMSVNARLIQI